MDSLTTKYKKRVRIKQDILILSSKESSTNE
jgi:hypothetical protein